MRPRQFDNDDVLRIAFGKFWRQGIRGTSLSDIAKEAGVLRGSLYNAYGSKEALFLSAYENYANDYLKNAERILSQGTLSERLHNFFQFAINNFCQETPSRGCPTTRGLMEIAAADKSGLDENARKAFANLLDSSIGLMENIFREAAEKGEFKGDPKMAAQHLITIARGLVVMESAFGDEDQLHQIAEHAIQTILQNS